MAPQARKTVSYQDLLNLPDTVIGEIIEGELVVSPRPSGPHTVVASALGGELQGPFYKGRGGPGGWWILDEPEIKFENHSKRLIRSMTQRKPLRLITSSLPPNC